MVFGVFRVLALVLIAIALMLLGADLLDSLEQGAFTSRETVEVWALFDEAGSARAMEWIDQSAPSYLAVPLGFIMNAYGYAVFGIAGILLAVLFGRRA